MTLDPDSPAQLRGRQRLALVVLLGAGFMLSVDFSILNVALPQMGEGAGITLADLPWIASAYALPAAGFTLLFGRVADLFGRRRLFLVAMVLLLAASLLGGFATNAATLLTARVLQGFANAIAIPAAMALLITAVTDDRARARVLGLNGALLSGGFTVGALVGGSLVSALDWRWAFWINVPVALVIVALTPFVVRESARPAGVKLDVPGAVAVTTGLLALVYGVLLRDWIAFVVGVVLLGVFWFIETRATAPLVSLQLLNRPSVKWGNFGGVVAFVMATGLNFVLTVYLQEVLDLTPFATGLVFGLPGLAAVFAGILAGRLIGRYGYRPVLAAGLLTQGLMVAPMLLIGDSTTSLYLVVPSLFLLYFGHVTAIVAYTVTATSDLEEGEAGLATGLTSLAQQIAVTIGIPIFGAIAATRSDLTEGVHLAMRVQVVAVTLAVVLIWIGLRTPRRGQPTATSNTKVAHERASS
ncbi:MFS transporter [Cryptosporangium aurantiacum]|uniref:Predicted arabinose efflux permease, MFS family n=1 Tax=Cryptosporangium aurantiacum TaxID=134849 RepID=A0A1M7RG78_9ACTN|nr:MFS transporter [Cryptosporangium aurantiacum]SHN45283.1 Predicted arabinose efflux permease, MFS family [Cryptosporangium aurantiacum]